MGEAKKESKKAEVAPAPGGVLLDGRAGYVIIIENPKTRHTTPKEA